jgi:hypothetical protein
MYVHYRQNKQGAVLQQPDVARYFFYPCVNNINSALFFSSKYHLLLRSFR